jgi:hypothetical protein
MLYTEIFLKKLSASQTQDWVKNPYVMCMSMIILWFSKKVGLRSNKKGRERDEEEEYAYYEIEAVCSIETLEKWHLFQMWHVRVWEFSIFL